jgi:hypothetical protein
MWWNLKWGYNAIMFRKYGLNPATFVLGLVALAWLGVKELVEELGWFRRR